MASLLDAVASGELPVRVAAVLCNRPHAKGLEVAAAKGVATRVIDHTLFADRETCDAAMAAAIDEFSPDMIVLSGFMRILSDGFVRRYEGRMVNIHPSLLPAFPGLDAQKQAFEYGVKFTGCTVHFVDEELDHGAIIKQAVVPVLPDDDDHILAERILTEEHRIYAEAINMVLRGAFKIEGRKIIEAG
jgi:phosphoribosylglycinamide formyltransferase-1